MSNEYKYTSEEDLILNNFPYAKKVIESQKLIIDSKHLPLIEAAEYGNMTAILDAAEAFAQGNIQGIPKNYIMAVSYMDMIVQINLEHENFKGTVEALKNRGITEEGFGYTEFAIKSYVEALDLMFKKLPHEDWDFEIHSRLKQIL